MRVRSHALILLAGALLAALVVAGCGGSDDGGTSVSGDTDAQQVLDTALGGNGDSIDSGVLDLSATLGSEGGSGTQADATVTGPFQSNGEGELPSLDFDVTAGAAVGGPKISFEGGVVLTPDGLFIGYNGTDYAIDEPTFEQIKQGYADAAQQRQDQTDGGSLSDLGIDPGSWLTDVSNEGEEDLEGTQVVHITGTADVAKIVADLTSVAQQSGQSQQLDSASLKQLGDAVQDASIDVYATADDGSLRELDLNFGIADVAGTGGAEMVAVKFGIADPNTSQEVTPPTDAKPIAELVGQLSGVASSLGGLGPADSGSTPGSAPPAGGGGGGGGGSGASGGGGPASGAAGDAYYQCVANAPTPADLVECEKFLKG